MAKLLHAASWLFTVAITAVLGGRMFCSNTETISYEPDEAVFNNALMGYAPDIDRRDEEESNLYYLGLTWREWEPEEGVYDIEGLEEKYGLKELKEKGAHLVLRFIADQPGKEEHIDIPDWLYEETGDGSFYDISYGKGYSPDYNNVILRAEHARAIAALGEYFGSDNFACYVELGSLGHWGEWHIKSDEGLVPMPEENIRDEYAEAYTKAFPEAWILMRRPFNIAAREGFGVYNDMTGAPVDTAEWINWLNNGGDYGSEKNALTAMQSWWLTAPAGGEFTSSISMQELASEEIERTEELLKATHLTFLGPKIPDKDDYPEGYDEVLKCLGYRLRVSSASLKRGLTGSKLTLTWVNDGTAPFYFNWDVNIYVEDEDGNVIETEKLPLDIREIAPGTERTVSVDLKELKLNAFKRVEGKTCTVSAGIVDPMTGENAVRFTMQAERTEDGRTVLLSGI